MDAAHFAEITASTAPTTSPMPTIIAASRITIRNTSARCAPIAIRTPISFLRCATMYEITPYNPITASNPASPPKNPVRVAIS